MTKLVGRARDLARLIEAISTPGLEVLVGPVGVGKTAVLAALVEHFGEAAVSIDARKIHHADSMLATLAEQVGIDHERAVSTSAQACAAVASWLAASGVELLVVDHLDQSSEDVFELLRTLAAQSLGVKVLAASRRFPAAAVGGVLRLRPLDLDASGTEEAPAAELFRNAFVRAGGDLAALEVDPAVVERVVASTGGLPLAISLVAARSAIAGFEVVRRDIDADHRSGSQMHSDPVAAALETSLVDITGDALVVFETVGAFRADLWPAEISAACALDVADVSVELERLAGRSLLEFTGDVVHMLGPIRRVARRSTAARHRTGDLLDRHAAWAVDVALDASASTTAILRLEPDLDWAVGEAVRTGRLHDAVLIATQLDEALRSDLRHARRVELLKPLLSACRSACAHQHAADQLIDDTIDVLRLTAMAHGDAFGAAAARQTLEESQQLILRSTRSAHHVARLESLRGGFAFDLGDLVVARRAAEAAIDAARASGDEVARYKAMKLLADIELESGNIERAAMLADEVVRRAPRSPRWLRSYAVAAVGAVELERGATALALAAAGQVEHDATVDGDLDLMVEADWLRAMADPRQASTADFVLDGDRVGNSTLHIQADIAAALRRLAAEDWKAAIALAADCELRACALPMRSLALDAQLLVGDAAVAMNEPAEALRSFRQALSDAVSSGFLLRVADALDGLGAAMALSAGPTGSVEGLHGTAHVIRGRLGAVARPRPWRSDPPAPSQQPPPGWLNGVVLTAEAVEQIRRLDETNRSSAHDAGTARLAALSPAERVVADLVAEGCTNREIGERLFVSRRTVESHIAHAFQKLGLSSRTQLAVMVVDGN